MNAPRSRRRDARATPSLALLLLFAGSGLGGVACAAPAGGAHLFARVRLDGAVQVGGGAPLSGRLLVFAKPAANARKGRRGGSPVTGPVTEVEPDLYSGEPVLIAAREVTGLRPGAEVDVDLDETAFPAAGWSAAAPGDYVVQAVLDRDHSYNFNGRGAGDVTSAVAPLHLPAAAGPSLTLGEVVPVRDPWKAPPGAPADRQARLDAARADARRVDVDSPALTRFFGALTGLHAWVLTPPGYAQHAGERYPTVYYTAGYGGTLDSMTGPLSYVHAAMAAGRMPPMIWVFVDESGPTGTNEFADGVNNGPWGQALTTEFIPELERRYRMDARASGRFLQGHSSGGWATMWLQTRYPEVFGGTWSTSPDPVDFHDFSGTDVYAPGANVYYFPDGKPRPIARDHARVLISARDETLAEDVLGDYGGQMRSFDWVFSPRGRDGRPLPLYDHATGAVDPQVAAYWRDHYDIAHHVQTDWPRLKPDLDGRVHLFVGTADTFYLDGAAHRLKAVMDSLGARSDIRFLPDRTHFDLYAKGGDRQALLNDIAWEMYATARPGSHRPAGS